jgi:hypothetical protein
VTIKDGSYSAFGTGNLVNSVRGTSCYWMGKKYIPVSQTKGRLGQKNLARMMVYKQLHMAMWQSQVDSPNTICPQLCYFTYLINGHMFVFLSAQRRVPLSGEKRINGRGLLTEH